MRAKVEEIVESTSGKLVKGDAESVVSGVSTDTRSISEGDLYVALEGPNFDGNKFAEGAVESKAGALLLREGHPDISGTVERLPDEAATLGLMVARTAAARFDAGRASCCSQSRNSVTLILPPPSTSTALNTWPSSPSVIRSLEMFASFRSARVNSAMSRAPDRSRS